MNVAEYIMQTLFDYGVTHCFTVIGGGAIHLNNALAHSKITPIYMHHESACGFAAEGYARIKGIGACLVTTGPGSTNAITACLSCWTDSVPVIFISGQVKTTNLKGGAIRQFGDQECDIISMVSGITKCAIEIPTNTDVADTIQYVLNKMMKGRPGPVWLSIPIDIQNKEIDVQPIDVDFHGVKQNKDPFLIGPIIQALKASQKPLLIVGQGVRLGKALPELNKFLSQQPFLPVLTSFEGMDLLAEDHRNYMGRFGIIGQRAGNKILMEADLVLCIGTRLNIRARTYEDANFAPQAKKIIIDIDFAELMKFKFPCEKICADAHEILNDLITLLPLMNCQDWVAHCKELKTHYLKFDPRIKRMNVYQEVYNTSIMSEHEIIVVANGFASIATYQSWVVKSNQRILMNSGTASMGWALSAAIGAYFASNQSVMCIEGDGSIMMNLGSLWVIKQYDLPIKIVLIDNSGYNSIKSTERSMNSKERYGADYGDLYFPNWNGLLEDFDCYILHVDPEQDYFVKVASHLENGKWVSDKLDDMSPHEDEKHD